MGGGGSKFLFNVNFGYLLVNKKNYIIYKSHRLLRHPKLLKLTIGASPGLGHNMFLVALNYKPMHAG